MQVVDKEKAKIFTNTLKRNLRKLIERHASEAKALSVNSDDPHTPILACIQMVFAQASAEYLLKAGATLPEAIDMTVTVTAKAMQSWLESLKKPDTKQ